MFRERWTADQRKRWRRKKKAVAEGNSQRSSGRAPGRDRSKRDRDREMGGDQQKGGSRKDRPWKEVKVILYTFDDNGVTCVITTRTPRDNVDILKGRKHREKRV